MIGSLTADSTNDFKAELDSHADTCVVGGNALVIQDYERTVCVCSYDSPIGLKDNCKLVSAVMAYDHPVSGKVYMLIVNQAILIPSLRQALLCPMPMRDNGL